MLGPLCDLLRVHSVVIWRAYTTVWGYDNAHGGKEGKEVKVKKPGDVRDIHDLVGE